MLLKLLSVQANPNSKTLKRYIKPCYSLVSEEEGISVSAVYKYDKEKDKIVSVKNASGLSPQRSKIIALNAWDWAQAIWKDMLT